MKVLDLISNDANVHMSSLKGYVEADYDQLVSLFGPPTYDSPSADDKVTAEWCLEFLVKEHDGSLNNVRATIYDWKSGDLCRNGKYNWHIGGFNMDSVEAVTQCVENNIKLVESV